MGLELQFRLEIRPYWFPGRHVGHAWVVVRSSSALRLHTHAVVVFESRMMGMYVGTQGMTEQRCSATRKGRTGRHWRGAQIQQDTPNTRTHPVTTHTHDDSNHTGKQHLSYHPQQREHTSCLHQGPNPHARTRLPPSCVCASCAPHAAWPFCAPRPLAYVASNAGWPRRDPSCASSWTMLFARPPPDPCLRPCATGRPSPRVCGDLSVSAAPTPHVLVAPVAAPPLRSLLVALLAPPALPPQPPHSRVQSLPPPHRHAPLPPKEVDANRNVDSRGRGNYGEAAADRGQNRQ